MVRGRGASGVDKWTDFYELFFPTRMAAQAFVALFNLTSFERSLCEPVSVQLNPMARHSAGQCALHRLESVYLDFNDVSDFMNELRSLVRTGGVRQ